MATQLLCNTCSKAIASEFVNLGEDRNYHPQCFNCSTCKKSLAGEQYFEMDNELYCESDYHKKFSPTCGGCHQTIYDEYMEVMGLNYHKQCFVCHGCKKVFGELQFFKYNGEPYCNECYAKKANECDNCRKPILDKTYSALNKTYHLDCFVCGVCTKTFDKGAFVPHEDKPYHPECYKAKFAKKCPVCNDAITGEYFDIDGANIHKDCFEKYKALNADEKKKLTEKQETTQTTTTTTITTSSTTTAHHNDDSKGQVSKEQPVKQETSPAKPEEKKEPVSPHFQTQTTATKTTTTQAKPEEKKEASIGIKVEVNLGKSEPILKTTVVASQKIEEGVKTNEKEGSSSGTIYPYELLIKPPFPKGVDPTKREQYLSFVEFERLFKMTWQEWEGLSKWKQNEAKKKLKLF